MSIGEFMKLDGSRLTIERRRGTVRVTAMHEELGTHSLKTFELDEFVAYPEQSIEAVVGDELEQIRKIDPGRIKQVLKR